MDTINAIIGIDSKEWVSSSSALSCFIPVKENDIVQYELSSTGRISFLKDKKYLSIHHYSLSLIFAIIKREIFNFLQKI